MPRQKPAPNNLGSEEHRKWVEDLWGLMIEYLKAYNSPESVEFRKNRVIR